MQEPNATGILKKDQNKKTVLWLAIFYIASDLIAFALGVGYLLTVIGLNGLSRLVIIYYPPARKKFFIWLSRDKSFDSPPPLMTWWRAISFTTNLILYIGMFAFGIWIILKNTFCQQNLICLFMQHP